jgi:hypothetical protein
MYLCIEWIEMLMEANLHKKTVESLIADEGIINLGAKLSILFKTIKILFLS